jgi:carbonic anhydrase
LIHVNPTTKQTAVLGIFLQSNKRHVRKSLTSTNSTLSEWENFFLASESLQEVNDSIILNLNLAKLININLKEFWRYTGSLTTPPCSEGIIWTVFKQPILVDDHLFQSFRNNLYSKDYREPQPLYNRIVYRNFLYDITPLTSDSNCCSNNFI